ncbi:MAG: hypothetical protein PHG69_05535 [Candidatus Omnitrophica bacterium]|nr:hypothetical protein [Candidatus Omnitrophota bacterium]
MIYFSKNLGEFSLATFCLAILILISQISGKRLISLGKFSFHSRLENFLISQALGLSIISYTIFFLGLIGAINRVNFIIIFIIILPLLFFSEIKNIYCEIKYGINNLKLISRFKKQPFLLKLAVILFVLFLVSNFLNALTPPIERDAMTYHLKMPQSYIKTGYIAPEAFNIFSYFPQFTEMLYTFGLIFSNDYSGHLIHLYFGILTALAIFYFVRRISDAETAFFCMLTFYSLPVVSQLSTWAYADLALCFFSILALGLFSLYLENPNRSFIKLSAVFLAVAFSIKYLAFISLYVFILLFMVNLAKTKQPKRMPLAKDGLYFLLILAVCAAPWYIRNVLLTGNPVYPFFYSVFKGPYWGIERANLYDIFLGAYGMGRSLIDYMLLPWRMALYGGLDGNFDAEIGIIYLALAPLIIFFRPKNKSANYIFIYSAVFFFIWTTLSQQTRFLLPAFAALSICLYAVFDCPLKEKVINSRSMRLLAIGLVSYNLFLGWQYFQGFKPFEFLSGKISRQEYLMKYLKDYPAINYMNTHLSGDSKTYMVGIGNIGYYCQKKFIQESVFDYPFKKALMEARSPGQILLWLKNQGATHILINEMIAINYLYPDLGQPQLDIYKKFHKNRLIPIYANGVIFLYKIVDSVNHLPI